MRKDRLAWAMDAALVVALAGILSELDIPWRQTLGDYWAERGQFFRLVTTALWLVGLWLGLYRPIDRAEWVSPPVVMLGATRLLCTLGTARAAVLIVIHPVSWLSQSIYGGVALASAVVDYLLLLCLERANADAPECAEASRRWRRVLMGAFLIIAAGIVLTVIKYRRAMWMSTAVAAVCLIGFWIAQWSDTNKTE